MKVASKPALRIQRHATWFEKQCDMKNMNQEKAKSIFPHNSCDKIQCLQGHSSKYFCGLFDKNKLRTKILLRKSNLLFFLTKDITQKYDPTLFVATHSFIFPQVFENPWT